MSTYPAYCPLSKISWVDKGLSRFYVTSVGIRSHNADPGVRLPGFFYFPLCVHPNGPGSVSSIYTFGLLFHVHAFLSHPALASLRLRVVFSSHPSAFPLLMYIRLRRLDHVPFPGVRTSVGDQIPRICSPRNESNKQDITLHFIGKNQKC